MAFLNFHFSTQWKLCSKISQNFRKISDGNFPWTTLLWRIYFFIVISNSPIIIYQSQPVPFLPFIRKDKEQWKKGPRKLAIYIFCLSKIFFLLLSFCCLFTKRTNCKPYGKRPNKLTEALHSLFTPTKNSIRIISRSTSQLHIHFPSLTLPRQNKFAAGGGGANPTIIFYFCFPLSLFSIFLLCQHASKK